MKTLTALTFALVLAAPGLARADEPAPSAPPPQPQLQPPVQAAPPMQPPAQMQPPPPPMAPRAEPQPMPEEPLTPPSRGIGLLIAGGVFAGLGVVNLATAPICKTSLIHGSSTQNACLIASLALGGTFVAVGTPLLIIGGVKRSAFKQWKADHPMAAGLGVSPVSGGAALTFGQQF